MEKEYLYQDTDFPKRDPLTLKESTAAFLNNQEGKQRYVKLTEKTEKVVIRPVKKKAAAVETMKVKPKKSPEPNESSQTVSVSEDEARWKPVKADKEEKKDTKKKKSKKKTTKKNKRG